MTITNDKIKIFMSENNTDNPDGGGNATNVILADGSLNNGLPDISRLDTVGGTVNLRKFHPKVDTDSVEIYYGAHGILTKTPFDPKVSALLFSTDSPSDTRVDAQKAIEAYVVASYLSGFYLFGAHVIGANSVTWLQRLQEAVPDVGDVYMLQSADGLEVEYIRIADIDPVEISLSHEGQDYQRRRIIAQIEQPLEFAHIGSTFDPDGQTAGTADTYNTQIANAAKFYGLKDVSVDANLGDLEVFVADIYEQIVPASKQQTPIINRSALLQGDVIIINPNQGIIETNFGLSSLTPTQTFPTSIVPLSFDWNSGAVVDDGNGNLIKNDNTKVGVINYVTGVFTYTGSVFGGNPIKYIPASSRAMVSAYTAATLVTQANQGTVFVQNISPIPSVGNFYINYISNGKWYQLNSNADGTIGGSNIGAGAINDNGDGTATISISLGALPDIDSSIIYTWGSDYSYDNAVAAINTTIELITTIQLPHGDIDPESLILNLYRYTPSNSLITFDADGVGSLTGVTLNAKTGLITTVGIDNIRESQTLTNVAYTYAANPESDTSIFRTYTNVGTPQIVTLPEPAVHRPTMVIWVEYDGVIPWGWGGVRIYPVTMRCEVQTDGTIVIATSRAVIGTVTAAGLITLAGSDLTAGRTVLTAIDIDNTLGLGYTSSVDAKYKNAKITSVYYQESPRPALDYDTVVAQESLDTDVSTRHILKLPHNTVGSFTFDIYTLSYHGRDGNIYETVTNEQVGTYDLTSETAEFKLASNPDVTFLFTQIYTDLMGDEIGVTNVAFKTSATKLTASSFQLRYKTVNQTDNVQVATTDQNGVVTGVDIDSNLSRVDTKNGMADIHFTAAVIRMDTLQYDAVAETNLPLDPDLLGLNPVRLPPDGRVPIFDKGRYLVIFNEVETDITPTPIANAVVNLARQGQAYIEVVDINGQRLAYDQFVADRVAGTVTFSATLALIDRQGDALTAPYRVIDRLEDMALCTNADLSGRISLSAPLTHNYPAATSKIASALTWGNVGARVFNLYSQTTFINWESQLHGTDTAAKYDDLNFPLQINNKDSFSGHFIIEFTSSAVVRIVEKSLGVIADGLPISGNLAPLNPATGFPYFTMLSGGFGSGWLTGNVIYFEVESGSVNFWLIRTVQSGTLTLTEDIIDVEIRGDGN